MLEPGRKSSFAGAPEVEVGSRDEHKSRSDSKTDMQTCLYPDLDVLYNRPRSWMFSETGSEYVSFRDGCGDVLEPGRESIFASAPEVGIGSRDEHICRLRVPE